MSEAKPKQPAADETTILHLNKFAPGQAEPASEEGATIFIKRAAEQTVQHANRRVIVPASAGALPAGDLLGTVAYCYAKGVYSSADIERKMLQDPEFRAALDGVVPDPQTIRRFRRMNREAIQEVLEKFYTRLRKQKPPTEVLPGAQPPAPAPPTPAANEVQRPEENTSMFVKREATERIDQATFIDGMSQDY